MIYGGGGDWGGEGKEKNERSVKFHEFPIFRFKILEAEMICCQSIRNVLRTRICFQSLCQ